MGNVCVVCHVKRVQTQLDNLLFASPGLVIPQMRNDQNFLDSQVQLHGSRSAAGVASDAEGTVIGKRIRVAVEAGGYIERGATGGRKNCTKLETPSQFENLHEIEPMPAIEIRRSRFCPQIVVIRRKRERSRRVVNGFRKNILCIRPRELPKPPAEADRHGIASRESGRFDPIDIQKIRIWTHSRCRQWRVDVTRAKEIQPAHKRVFDGNRGTIPKLLLNADGGVQQIRRSNIGGHARNAWQRRGEYAAQKRVWKRRIGNH